MDCNVREFKKDILPLYPWLESLGNWATPVGLALIVLAAIMGIGSKVCLTNSWIDFDCNPSPWYTYNWIMPTFIARIAVSVAGLMTRTNKRV